MGYTGINLENVKVNNRSSILKLLNDKGTMSRKDIANHLGLTPAAVTLICSEFLSAGKLIETGEVMDEKRAGRRKVLLEINRTYRTVLSICIEADGIFIGLCDLKGKSKGLKRLSNEEKAAPEELLKRIAAESKALMWECGIPKEQVLGAGISVPGPVNREIGISEHAYRIWESAVPVAKIMRDLLGMPVVVENNVKALAQGELIFGEGRTSDTLLLVKWGPGIGAAVASQNLGSRGEHVEAAEIGHYIIKKNGKPCSCGGRGCLETFASIHGMKEGVLEVFSKEKTPLLYERLKGDAANLHSDTIYKLMSGEIPEMTDYFQSVLDMVARVVMNTVTLFHAKRVILCGSVFSVNEIRKAFLQMCSQYHSFYKDTVMVESSVITQVEYIGAAAIAINDLFLMAQEYI